jgi:tight adherence protein B
MILSTLVFLVTTLLVLGTYFGLSQRSNKRAQKQVELRLRELGQGSDPEAASVLARQVEGPMPQIDHLIAKTDAGSRLARLIEQSGVSTTPSAVVVGAFALAVIAALITRIFVHVPFAPLLAAVAGFVLPFLFLTQRRTARLKKFEEQFPESLDLISRAIRAGHAFQTALGMVAAELKAPVGPEFKKTFDQQNFGLPLHEALNDLAARVPLVDVRFFITAVAIQRETGGNLAEILDNLARVVRERFKIRRQIRVHTAHGRFTGYVLVALPAFVGVMLTFINPDHMSVLFREHMGQMMLAATVVMQIVGFFWIRQIVRIEV